MGTGKGGKKLPREVLVEALTTGRVPIGLEKELAALVDTAPDPTVLSMVRVTGTSTGLPPQAVWKNARSLAKAVGSSRKGWLHGG